MHTKNYHDRDETFKFFIAKQNFQWIRPLQYFKPLFCSDIYIKAYFVKWGEIVVETNEGLVDVVIVSRYVVIIIFLNLGDLEEE